MNSDIIELAKTLISKPYAEQGQQSRRQREKLLQALLSNRRLPEDGWDNVTIELIMAEFASMDSNNFIGSVGVGEREARIFSELVSKRNFRLGHGIGRSGDIAAVQPKAAGSSLLNKIANIVALSAIKIGIPETKACLVLPTATGMALVLTLLALRQKIYGDGPYGERKYVIWPRMDQKTCLKAIFTAGFEPIVIEPVLVGDELVTDVAAIETRINALGAKLVLCVLSTSSCFAPRAPDLLPQIARVCAKTGVAHIVNNAYGLQSQTICDLIQKASRVGRVDAFIQSTDKNFLVPVGGSIVASFDKEFIEDVSKTYPGRASSSPIIDLFITLVSMGASKYRQLRKEREVLMQYFKNRMSEIAQKYGEKLLETPSNPISLGITLSRFDSESQSCSYIGSMLFQRRCSGVRTVPKSLEKDVCGIKFTGYGSSSSSYPHSYLVCAAAIGITEKDIDVFTERLDKVMKKCSTRKVSNCSESHIENKIQVVDFRNICEHGSSEEIMHNSSNADTQCAQDIQSTSLEMSFEELMFPRFTRTTHVMFFAFAVGLLSAIMIGRRK
eukprot:253053_1